jgi:hypothetical protein
LPLEAALLAKEVTLVVLRLVNDELPKMVVTLTMFGFAMIAP